MKKVLGSIVLIMAIIAATHYVIKKNAPAPKPVKNEVKMVALANDPKNATYQVDGDTITLINGVSEMAVPESTGKISTRYFGNEATGDLNNDGRTDTALILVQETGGTGVFYYAVVALNMTDGYKGTNAVFLGDRISPQTTEIKNGKVIVNYADRKQNEALSSTPTVGVSKYLAVKDSVLIEVSK